MSMENAILVHAEALNKLAEAIRAAYGSSVALAATAVGNLDGVDLFEDKAADLASATKERTAAARDAKAKDAQQNAAEQETQVLDKAEMEKAVAAVEKAAKEEQADDADLAGPLDYAKDVRPVLLATIRKVGKDKVAALIATFGADKAEKVDPAKFGELLAGAEKLAA